MRLYKHPSMKLTKDFTALDQSVVHTWCPSLSQLVYFEYKPVYIQL